MKKIIILIFVIFLYSCNNTGISQNNYEKIAKIPEASGICYMQNLEKLFVANDEGKIYEIDKSGKILNNKNIGNYDFEGIVCDEKNNEIYLLLEDSGNLLKINSKTLEIVGDFILDLNKSDRKKYFNKKSGAEGLAYDGEYFYISTQNDKNNLLKFKRKKENSKKSENLKLKKIFDIDYEDLSGMTFYKNDLYILSDKNDSIFKYDLEKEKIIETIKLDKGSWEGIVFDENSKIFLADDDGEIVIFK